MKYLLILAAFSLSLTAGCRCSQEEPLDQEIPIEEQRDFEQLDNPPEDLDQGELPVEELPR